MTHRTQRAIASIAALTFLLNPLVVYAQIITFNDPNVVIPTLLNPIEYGIHASAQEIPSLRTLKTATFDLGNGKKTITTIPKNVFTTHPQDSNLIVLASSKGVQKGSLFVFEYLPQETRISFDLTKPSYTLTQKGNTFTLSFPVTSNVSGEILNDHQIAYQLSKTARLIWTVQGSDVKKEIYVTKSPTETKQSSHFPFSISSNLTPFLKEESMLHLQDDRGLTQVSFEKPLLLSTDHQPLILPISLEQTNSGLWTYVYDESLLPEKYIVDPTAGPQGASSGDFGAYNDSGTCQGTSCLASTTPVIDTSTTLHAVIGGFGLSSSVLVEGVSVSVTARAEAVSGDCGVFVQNTLLSNNVGGPWDNITVDTDNLCGGSDTTVSGNYNPNESSNYFDATTFNNSNLALDISFTSTNADGGDIITVTSVNMTLTYSEAASCTMGSDCSAGARTCISGTCGECTSDDQCAGNSGCDESTGRCSAGYIGNDVGGFSNQCFTGYVNGNICAMPTSRYIICSLANATLPSGVTMVTASAGTSIAFNNDIFRRSHIGVLFKKSGTKIVETNIMHEANASECLVSFIANTSLATYSSVFYASDIPGANTDNKHDLFIKKTHLHNKIRFCAGKNSLGCTSGNSWSFLANANGTIESTNGGFDTTGIQVHVLGGYWRLTNVPFGSAQGEAATNLGTVCTLATHCSDRKACVSGQCIACTTNSQCPSNNCSGGQCLGAVLGGSCSANSDCISNKCFGGKCTSGNECSYESNALPSGVTMHLKSDNSSIAFSDLPEGVPTDVYFAKSDVKFSELTLTQISGADACLVDLNADLNASSYTAVFHAPDAPLGSSGNTYTMYIPKSASHDQIRICSEKTSIGCTSADSWSFIANSAGSIFATNGDFNTTGITVSVSGGSWVITGLTGTSAEGEASGGGGGGGGAPADVPEFSTYGLLILIGGCYLMLRQNNAIGA